MAKRKVKSGLAAQLGSAGRKAHEAHKDDTTTFDEGGSLPAGIENGIAKLVDVRFDTYKKGDNKGKFFFLAAGVVVVPLEHDGIPIEGLRTQIMEPMCDTPTRTRETVADHIGWVYNELAKLGVDREDLDPDTLEETAKALVKTSEEEGLFFRFRTWKGEKQTTGPYAGKEPRTNEVWGGACDYDESGGSEDGMSEDPVDNEVIEDEDPEDSSTEDSSTEAEAESEETIDYLALAETADGDDEAAQTELGEAAEALGIDPNDIDSWLGVAEAIIEASDPESEDATVEPPEKGGVYKYKPPGKRKAVECKCLAVFKSKETCNLKDLATSASYKSVSWNDLEAE